MDVERNIGQLLAASSIGLKRHFYSDCVITIAWSNFYSCLCVLG